MSKMLGRHRDFLYKRSQNGALAAPLIPASTNQGQTPDAPAAAADASPDPKSSVVSNLLTSVGPVTLTSDTPATSASPNTTPTPQSTASSPSSVSPSQSPSSPSSSSPSQASSTAASSSASARTTASVATTKLNQGSSASSYATPLLSTNTVIGVSLTSASTLAPATTSSSGSGSSGGTNTGTIVGGIAGTLAGVAILGFLLMWCMRRQRGRDVDDFDAQAFKRQSAVLVDDPVEPPRSYNPRPPTMIERHNASPALAAQTGYGGQNFYGNYGGYGQQPPFAPSESIQSPGSPPPQGYGAPPMAYTGYNDPQQRIIGQPNVGPTPYDGPQQLARQPSSAAYLTRQPSSVAGYTHPIALPGSLDPNTQYIDLNRSSVSPYQAVQYADISRQLGAADPNSQVPQQPLELPEDPLPSPFDDPVGATPSGPHHFGHPAEMATPGPVSAASVPQTQGNITEPHQRPVTVYEEGDAYGGI